MCAARKRCAIIRPAPSRPRPVPSPTRSPAATATPTSGTEAVDRRFLQSLVGFNARMATLKVISQFIPRMAPFELRVGDFSILSLIHHNPGITSRQLCDALNLLPPNLVGKVNALQRRGLLLRRPHPDDGRAQALHLTDAGLELMRRAEPTVVALENEAAAALTVTERQTLIRLLQKVYQD